MYDKYKIIYAPEESNNLIQFENNIAGFFMQQNSQIDKW